MPTKFLKPKNMRRGLLALLLAAPLVYMFGSLFFALNGAHGYMPLTSNDEVATLTLISSDFSQGTIYSSTGDFSNSDTYIYTRPLRVQSNHISVLVDFDLSIQSIGVFFYTDINANNSSYTGIYDITSYSSDNLFVIPSNSNYFRFRIGSTTSIRPSNVDNVVFHYINEESTSDYIFGQFFAEDNWVASLGEKAVNNETGIGLPFVGDLISYIDENAMPFSNSAYGYFIWGYSSYILNVLAIYMVVSIAASLVLIPMKVVDSLEERING